MCSAVRTGLFLLGGPGKRSRVFPGPRAANSVAVLLGTKISRPDESSDRYLFRLNALCCCAEPRTEFTCCYPFATPSQSKQLCDALAVVIMAGGGCCGGVPGTYNDGGYWGNDLDHVLQVVAMASHSTACELLHDAVVNFQENGFQEWQLGPPNTTRGSCMYLLCNTIVSYFWIQNQQHVGKPARLIEMDPLLLISHRFIDLNCPTGLR